MRDGGLLLALAFFGIAVAVWWLAGLARDLWAIHCARRTARRYMEPPLEIHLARPGKVLRFERPEPHHERELDRGHWN